MLLIITVLWFPNTYTCNNGFSYYNKYDYNYTVDLFCMLCLSRSEEYKYNSHNKITF